MRRPVSLRRAAALFRIEARQLLNDRSVLLLIFGLPIMQILLYGYGVRFTPRQVPVAVATDVAVLAPRLSHAFEHDPVLRLAGPVGLPGSALAAVAHGRAQLGLEVDAAAGGSARVRLFADGTDMTTAAPALARLQLGVWRTAAEVGSETPPNVVVDWLHAAPDRESSATAPGLVGVVIMVSMLFLGAMALVREREGGTWESLLATPISPLDVLAGKLGPYLVIAVVETALLLVLVRLLFGVPLAWSALALVAAAPLFGGAYLALGFVFSSLARTQLQAVQGAVAVYLPSLLLSGFLFPFSGLPTWARVLGEALPLTHYLRASRAILLGGAPPAAMLGQLWPVLAFGAGACMLAAWSYRRRLD